MESNPLDFTPYCKKCKLEYVEIVIADPAKNITILVLDRIDSAPARAEAARRLLADPSLKAEQVGFVIVPDGAHTKWRLEMMGGEFCGNAARSFGLFVARETGLKGRHTVMIEISGMQKSLPVHVDTEAGRAEVEIPRPLAQGSLNFEGRSFPVFVFEGITHVIAPGLKPEPAAAERDTFFAIKALIEKGVQNHFDALGVMFYDTQNQFLRPAVYVAATDSLVFESSCGSGSAALACWKTAALRDGDGRCDVAQSGGIIEVRVSKHEGEISSITIGGPVGLSGRMKG
ncbi:diaminopimelate epimerase [Spirochaetia bacterium]|nr:diaminopimelate epimerase [Spirochaetia bacterium]